MGFIFPNVVKVDFVGAVIYFVGHEERDICEKNKSVKEICVSDNVQYDALLLTGHFNTKLF